MSGGYDQESRSDGPPRNVLSQETIRQALARANSSQSQSSRGGPGQGMGSRSNTSQSMSSRPDPPRRSSTTTSGRKQSSHGNCDCIDCRDTSARDSYGSTRTDKNGDRVREWDGDGAPPMHCHVQPGLFDEEETSNRPPSSRNSGRKNSGGSPGRKNSENRTFTRDKEGNLVEEWDGSEAPPIRAHYNWDDPEGQGQSGGRRSPKERKSSRVGGY